MQYKEPEIFKPDYKELEKLVLKYDLTIYRRILVVEQYKLTLINRNESLLRARHNFSVLLEFEIYLRDNKKVLSLLKKYLNNEINSFILYSNLLDHQDEMASIVLDVEEQLVLDCIFLFTPTLLTVKFGQLIDKLMEEFNKLMTKSQFYHDELEFRAVIEDIYQEMKFLLK